MEPSRQTVCAIMTLRRAAHSEPLGSPFGSMLWSIVLEGK